MKITFDIVILLRPFALTASSGQSSTENQNLKKNNTNACKSRA